MTAAQDWDMIRERPLWPDYGVGPEEEGLLEWGHAEEQLTRSRNYWIASTRPDGRPHAAPVWGVWLDGRLYFSTGRTSVKGRNLAGRPAVAVHLESGDDVVIVEGQAREVTAAEERAAVAAVYQEKYDIDPGGPEDSDSPMFAVEPRTAYAWREQDYPRTVTRWRMIGRGSDA